jgi:hypothetical protein
MIRLSDGGSGTVRDPKRLARRPPNVAAHDWPRWHSLSLERGPAHAVATESASGLQPNTPKAAAAS